MQVPDTTRLERWIRDQILHERAAGKVVRFELRHLSVGAKMGQDVCTIDVREDDICEGWFNSTTAHLLSSANSDADGIGEGTQRYVVLVYRAEEPDKSRGRFAFVVACVADKEENEGYESEPPNKIGVLSQTMRHNEALQRAMNERDRIYFGTMSSLLGHVQRMCGTLSEENERLRNKELENIHVTQELFDMRDQRLLEAKKADAGIEMRTKMLEEIKLLGPAIINRLAGKDVVPQAKDGKSIAIERFVESLTEEQKLEFSKHLTSSQQIALLELINSSMAH
jgi:hypothetical protein